MSYCAWIVIFSFPAVSSIDISLKPFPLWVFDFNPLTTADPGWGYGGEFSPL